MRNFFIAKAVKTPENSLPTIDGESPILENFKNRKEVYLFSTIYKHRPAKDRELAEWYFKEVLLTGWIQRKPVIR